MNSPLGKRHKRMPLDSAVFMLRGGNSWSSEILDISATGVAASRPDDFDAQPGDRFILDMLIGEELNIHLEATVARLNDHEVGFAFSRIPPEKEVPLWELLGGNADTLESYSGG